MNVSITHFRRNLFSLVNQALEGEELWVVHQGRRLRLTPEEVPAGRLACVTPIQLQTNPMEDLASPGLSAELLGPMESEWEKDWAEL